MGSVPGTTALVEGTTRQLCATWQGWYATFATGWHYRASKEVSNGVGCPAVGAQRLSVGRVTDTIALLEVTASVPCECVQSFPPSALASTLPTLVVEQYR